MAYTRSQPASPGLGEDHHGALPGSRKGDVDGTGSDIETRFALDKQQPRFWTRRKIMVAVVSTILVLGLTLGLALGLCLNRPGGGSGSVEPAPGGGSGNGTGTGTGTGGGTPTSIWQPVAGTTWQIVLSQRLSIDGNNPSMTPDVDVYDIDLYENTKQGTDTSTITALHKAGKKVMCYFSAGTYEDWRADKSQFQPSDLGADLKDWKGEKWLQLKSDNVAKIIRARIQLAAKMGCDAIDPDNTDAYNNDGGGLGLTEADTVNFVKNVIVDEAKKLNLAVGLKNSGAVIPQLLPHVQFSVNEQCSQYNECKQYADTFIKANKPVFHIEYPAGISEAAGLSSRDSLCVRDGSGADMSKFSTVIKKMNLDAWVQYCSGTIQKSSVM